MRRGPKTRTPPATAPSPLTRPASREAVKPLDLHVLRVEPA
jgi:hypothetical protein